MVQCLDFTIILNLQWLKNDLLIKYSTHGMESILGLDLTASDVQSMIYTAKPK